MASMPWAYLATNQMLSAAARETLLDFLNWNTTVSAIPESGHKDRRPNRAMPADAAIIAAAAAEEEARWGALREPKTKIVVNI